MTDQAKPKIRTVAELIAALSAVDGASMVVIEGCCRSCWSDIGAVEKDDDDPIIVLRQAND